MAPNAARARRMNYVIPMDANKNVSWMRSQPKIPMIGALALKDTIAFQMEHA